MLSFRKNSNSYNLWLVFSCLWILWLNTQLVSNCVRDSELQIELYIVAYVSVTIIQHTCPLNVIVCICFFILWRNFWLNKTNARKPFVSFAILWSLTTLFIFSSTVFKHISCPNNSQLKLILNQTLLFSTNDPQGQRIHNALNVASIYFLLLMFHC